MSPRIRFVVHDGTRTGPPMFALALVAWLAEHRDLDLGVVLLGGGPLAPEFAAVCRTAVWPEDPDAARSLLDEADLVYINTAISIRVLRDLDRRPPVVVTHVHELEVGLSYWLADDDRELLLSSTDRYLVGAECAADNLVRHHGVAPTDIGRVPYFSPRPVPGGPLPVPVGAPPVGPGSVVVGASGPVEWRKGPDLFARVAWEARRIAPDLDLVFLWVGGPIPTGRHWDQDGDLALLGLDDRVHFVGHQADPLPWFQMFDLLLLTSRDDTLPLVCLEAGSMGVPIITFDGGGTPELVGASGGGRVVAFPDAPQMAAQVVALARDDEARSQLGARLSSHIHEHHRIDRAGQAAVDELDGLLG